MAPSNSAEENTLSSPLHDAVKLGSITTVRKLLSKKTSILTLDADGNSPLHQAFINKNILITDLILKDIQNTSEEYTNLKNKEGLSHLHIACSRRLEKVVQGFLDAGANAEDAVSDESMFWAGFTAAHFAITFKSLEALKVLLKFGINKQRKNHAGETPLSLAYQSVEDWLIMIDLLENNEAGKSLSNFHVACLTKDDKMVKNFIDHGMKVNSKTGWRTSVQCSSSSLHCAVASRDLKKVQLLLEKGANINSKNLDKMTPLHLAFYNENPQYADRENTVGIVDLLYNAIEDKSTGYTDRYGLNYFHIAVTRNDVPTVKEYLHNGEVNVNKPISYGAPRFAKYTPLQLAVWYQHLEMVELLLECGADVNVAVVKKKSDTPLYMAFRAGDIDFIELFLKNGAKVNGVVNKNKETMLHQVTWHCSYESPSRRGDQLHENKKAILMYIDQLVRLGIDVNAKDSNGETAMHLISLEADENVEYFQLLLDLGADINLQDDGDHMPYNWHNKKQQRNNLKACATFYHHIQKLKALGVKIHPKNEEYCKMILKEKCFKDKELMHREEQRLNEISKMKNVMIGAATSLYDFLNFDVERAALYGRALKSVAEDAYLKKKYPFYAYLIQLQYRKADDFLRGKDVTRKRSGSNTGIIPSAKRRRYV